MSEKSEFSNAKQICKLQNAKKLLEFTDELKPAPTCSFAKLHANGDTTDGARQYSRIKLVMLDYSAGTGDKTKRAEFNLSPEEVLYLLDETRRELSAFKSFQNNRSATESLMSKQKTIIHLLDFIKKSFSTKEALEEKSAIVDLVKMYSSLEYREDKIIGKTVDKDGRSPMTRLTIARIPFAPDGSPMKSPWKISIDKGTAVAEKTSVGGSYAKSGTFKSDNNGALTFNASDKDWLTALIKCERTISVFEVVVCGKIYKEGRAAEIEAAAQRANDKN